MKYIILSRREVKIMADMKKKPPMPDMKGAPRIKNPGKVIKRLLSYLKGYTGRFIFVLICIVISAGASAFSAMFIQILIDGYITPLIGQKNPDFTNMLIMILTVAGILLIGALAGLAYNFIMVGISQGIQKKIRDLTDIVMII